MATATTANPPAKPGRPKDAKTQPREQSVAAPSRCKKCGSTERSKYIGRPNITEYAGTRNGEPYTHVVRRRTKCSACGQSRFDISHENRTKGKPLAETE